MNPENGQVAGRITCAETKTYNVTLQAKNSKGSYAKAFRIVVGDKIALTPPLGWNSWNCWHQRVSQAKVLESIKANVPASITHVSDRMCLSDPVIPKGLSIPDPPIVIDYSGGIDAWSVRHEAFARAMNSRKYPLFFYWGAFGHGNKHAQIMGVNDLINSLDWLAIRKEVGDTIPSTFGVLCYKSCTARLILNIVQGLSGH